MPPWELLPKTLKNLFFPPEKREYTYFRDVVAHPYVGGNCVTKGAWAADAAMLSYARYGKRKMERSELLTILEGAGLHLEQEFGDWSVDGSGTQGFFLTGNDKATGEDFAFLAFRGTEADDKTDGFDDLNLSPVEEIDYKPAPMHHGFALAHLSTAMLYLETQVHDGPGYEAACRVHLGFQRALNSIWESVHACVTAYRESHPTAEICFTGHSLGAALAVLSFSRFRDDQNSLYTFGCPRVGNEAFRRRALTNRGRGVYRFVNENDTVAHIPLEASAYYKHVPEMSLSFEDGGALRAVKESFTLDMGALWKVITGIHWTLSTDLGKITAPDGVADHSPARYCMRMWNYVLTTEEQSIAALCAQVSG